MEDEVSSDLTKKCTVSLSTEDDLIPCPPSPVRLPFDRALFKMHQAQHHKSRKPRSVKLTRAFDKLTSVLPELQMEKFRRMDAICKEVFQILQRKSRFKVQRYVLSKFDPKCLMVIDQPKGGADNLHKVTGDITLSGILNEFEFCLKSFLASEQTSTDQNNNEGQLELFCLSKTNRLTLRLICDGIQLEIIPALNFVHDTLSRTLKEEFLQEQREGVLARLQGYPGPTSPTVENPSLAFDEYRQLLENSLLEVHFDALSQQTEFVQRMLHVVKLWESVSIWLDSVANPVPLSNDELMDIITINAAQREEETCRPPSASEELEDLRGAAALVAPEKEKPSYLRAFRKYLVSIQLFLNLRINLSKKQPLFVGNGISLEEGPDKHRQELPYIVGFANPYKNLAAVTEGYLLSKFAHAAVTVGFSYTDFDTFCNSERDDAFSTSNFENLGNEKLLRPGADELKMEANTDGLELFCVIVPYILINEVPEYITALDKIRHEITQAGFGPPGLTVTELYDLTSYVRKVIESGKFKLPEDQEAPTSLEKTFKLFNLCDPPSNLQPLLTEFQNSEFAPYITDPDELFNQLALYEHIQSFEPLPKYGRISVEKNESLTWMKFVDCKHVGFNIRSVVFEDNSLAFQFLQMLATNVELIVLSMSVGQITRGKSLKPKSMLSHLEKHVLTFLNSSTGLISLVEWNLEADSDESAVENGQGQGGATATKRSTRTSDKGVKQEHRNYDVTYIVPYSILVDDEPVSADYPSVSTFGLEEKTRSAPTAVNYAVISLNW